MQIRSFAIRLSRDISFMQRFRRVTLIRHRPYIISSPGIPVKNMSTTHLDSILPWPEYFKQIMHSTSKKMFFFLLFTSRHENAHKRNSNTPALTNCRSVIDMAAVVRSSSTSSLVPGVSAFLVMVARRRTQRPS